MKPIVTYLLVIIELSYVIAQDAGKIDHAMRLVTEGQNDSALVILEKLYELNSKDPQVNYLLGTIALRNGNYDSSIDYLDDAIAVDESN